VKTRWVPSCRRRIQLHAELVVWRRVPSLHGRSRFTLTDLAGILSRNQPHQPDVDTVTARINYRWGGPVVAKY
jgi:hypothetical protein